MRHDTAIPLELHVGARHDVKDALGLFWSSLFRDQELVDATVTARVLSACQAYIDAMEALSLRDHSGLPVFHREHWHPLFVRLSERNTGCGLVVGMDGDPEIGAQPAGSVFTPGEVFVVGGNAEYSKVHTYPLDGAIRDSLVSVGTCICDSIAYPDHVLVQGRDFMLRDGVLLIRKEHDPFTSGGYRIVEDGQDRIAVLWLCDAEFDRRHVGDFLAYPLGFDVASTKAAADMLSALWDIVIYGMTPLHINILLGTMFGVPTVRRDTVVESVAESAGVSTVVTGDEVYKIPTSRLADTVAAGVRLPAGTMLTNDISVYHGLSQPEVEARIADGRITSLTLPPGSVAGVDEDVTLANVESTPVAGASGAAEWFKLNTSDSVDSPFWSAVFSRTTAAERTELCTRLVRNGTINPLRSLGYAALANTVLVYTSRALVDEPCARHVLAMLRRLMPATGSILVVQTVDVGVSASSVAQASVAPVSSGGPAGSAKSGADVVAMSDDVAYSTPVCAVADSSMPAASDDVAIRFFPDAITEV